MILLEKNHLFIFMRYIIVLIAAALLFVYLYKRAIQDFRSGYEEGLEIGNALSKKKRSNKERRQDNSDN